MEDQWTRCRGETDCRAGMTGGGMRCRTEFIHVYGVLTSALQISSAFSTERCQTVAPTVTAEPQEDPKESQRVEWADLVTKRQKHLSMTAKRYVRKSSLNVNMFS